MNYHIQYTTPEKNDICVAFSFFNPCGYVRTLQNLLFFENKLRLAKIPYFSAEMIIGDQNPMLANPTLLYKSSSYLFYKEALFNKIEKVIPEQYTKIIFLDTDVIFDCPNWVDKISVLLDTHDVAQVFSQMCYLDLSYKENHWMNASIKDFNNSGTGFGWALTRSFYHKIGGFFDKCAIGSGDSIFYNSIINKVVMKYPVIQPFIQEYNTRVTNIKPKYTYLNANIYHLSHGSRVNRQYVDRYDILGKLNLPWEGLFYKNKDEFWELLDPKINQQFLHYFKNRNEDSICSFTTISNKIPIGASPPKYVTLMSKQESQTKGHSGPYHIPKKIQSVEKARSSKANLSSPVQIVHSQQKQVSVMPTINKYQSIAQPKPKAIPRYLTPPSNIQHVLKNKNTSVSDAAAVKSMEKRAHIRNTVVYNRAPVVSSRHYDSDNDSD